jgi:flagellin-like protein
MVAVLAFHAQSPTVAVAVAVAVTVVAKWCSRRGRGA